MENYSEQFNYVVNKNIGWVHTNKYILPVLSLFLGMYAALARPTLPNFIIKLFENPVFRLVMISYVIYRGNQDPQLSLMIASTFLITMHMINKQKVENFGKSKNKKNSNTKNAKKMIDGGNEIGSAFNKDNNDSNTKKAKTVVKGSSTVVNSGANIYKSTKKNKKKK